MRLTKISKRMSQGDGRVEKEQGQEQHFDDVMDLLETDHNLVEGLLESIENAFEEENTKDLDGLIQSLVQEVKTHAKAEERFLYPACIEKGGECKEMALISLEEHMLIEQMIDKLASLSPQEDEDRFCAVLDVTKELIEHHVEEEENELFPLLSKEFEVEELKEICQNIERFEDESQISPFPEQPGREQSEAA
jgi:hemerythrin-like domain-containing protein